MNEFYQCVLKSFTEEITDKVFLYIQDNPELMKQYRTLVNANSLNQVTSGIGKEIKCFFELKMIFSVPLWFLYG